MTVSHWCNNIYLIDVVPLDININIYLMTSVFGFAHYVH